MKRLEMLLDSSRLHSGIATILLLGFILLVSGAFTANGHVFNTFEQESQCVLKTNASECDLKPNEVLNPLPLDRELTTDIKGGERHVYRIELTEGQYFRAIVEQMGIDLTILVCGPSGQRAAKVDRQSGSWGPEAVSLIARASGEYRLQIRTVGDATTSGSYRIGVKEIREARPLDEVRVAAEKIGTEGGDYYAKGKPDCLRESIKRYEEALRLWQSLDDKHEIALTLFGLGWSQSDLGTYGTVKFPTPQYRLRWSYESRDFHLKALESFDQALVLLESQGDRHGQAIDLAGRAWPNLYLGRNQAALEDFSRARELFHSLANKRGEAIASYGLGWSYALLNDNQKALDNFLFALSLRDAVADQKGGANTLAAISRIYSRLGKNQAALDYGSRALKRYELAGDTHGQASTEAILGWVYSALSRWSESLIAFEQALQLRDATDPTGRANVLYGIARVKNEQGDLPGALSKMQEVRDIIEPLRSQGSSSDLRNYYFANVQEYYQFEIDLLMRMHQLQPAAGFAQRALSVNERARARELLAILAESDAGHNGEIETGLVTPIDSAAEKELLDDDTLLLEYSLGKQRSYLWLVSTKDISSYELTQREEIESRANRLYELMTNRRAQRPGAADWKETAARVDVEVEKLRKELGQILIGQIDQKLGDKRLIVVTQGPLQLVPFGALLVRPPSGSGTEPLIMRHEILTAPSGSVLNMLRRNATSSVRASKVVAVFADPVFSRDDPRVPLASNRANSTFLAARTVTTSGTIDANPQSTGATIERNYRRLPGTRWEAEQIISLVPKADGFLAVDFAANRDTAMSPLLQEYRIIHFATHALVDNSNPTSSRIVLSQFDDHGAPRDGDLSLVDIYKLKLQADLVVLSACRTGGGTDYNGEGLVGLTGGFMHSGVPRVLVSLWPISDTVTAQFMSRFYRKVLGRDKMTPARALREVQIEMLKDERWKAPYFWAPFILTGDWK